MILDFIEFSSHSETFYIDDKMFKFNHVNLTILRTLQIDYPACSWSVSVKV